MMRACTSEMLELESSEFSAALREDDMQSRCSSVRPLTEVSGFRWSAAGKPSNEIFLTGMELMTT